MDFLTARLLLVVFCGFLAMRLISPCAGCDVDADGRTDGDCEKDCAAFIAFQKRMNRLK